ncbi:type II toxin-antitoxin system RelB/DinJ family antitoxin [Parvibaculum sp.]|jgi:addiction module RelB/DinJ family antitoxin|uniref:type II toxin-antitoxin system RelB/DinJ family antitoxin n=1 Tax=Parvibaculum sp. TaxID=2024848 RepID=UPI0026A82711|tara:strand:+ start:35614 stop:35790 length:177 start_codon:yes stop_codon:yes gene_type:complete
MAYDAKIRVRVDPEVKAEAMRILSEHGLTMSEFGRLALQRLNEAKGIPFPVEGKLPRK